MIRNLGWLMFGIAAVLAMLAGTGVPPVHAATNLAAATVTPTPTGKSKGGTQGTNPNVGTIAITPSTAAGSGFFGLPNTGGATSGAMTRLTHSGARLRRHEWTPLLAFLVMLGGLLLLGTVRRPRLQLGDARLYQ
jgi:hypothetical protein